MLGTITLSSSPDRYFCYLNGDGTYRVKDIRSELDDLFLPSSAVATRWVNLVPIKVNIFAWRVSLDRLPTRDALWSRFIRAVHGNSGGIETHSRVGNGLNTMFWEDVWIGNKNFKTSFPRIYALESDKNLIVVDKMAHNDTAFSLRRQPKDGVEMEQFRALSIVIEGVLLHDMVDRWKWTLEGSGEFSVASARKFIDNSWLI
nr:RNA-directed DNA polymerase, eukaryota, reverse transcriptase zinc-binding domain protein [Tanacetum cinerariifolium]